MLTEVFEMEYVYAALLLHSAKKDITEENVKKVLEGAGIKVDEARVKALIAALEGVNIDEAIEKGVPVASAPAAAPASPAESKAEKKEEKKEEKTEEEAAGGLASLFG